VKSSSQRKGLKPVSELVQIDGMSAGLRASYQQSFMFDSYAERRIGDFAIDVWLQYFKN
jgi:hypothetical protein